MATYMVSQDSSLFSGLVIENTFTSIPDMVDQIFWFVGYFKWLILCIKWDTKTLIKHVTLPLLFVTGDEDELVPWEQT